MLNVSMKGFIALVFCTLFSPVIAKYSPQQVNKDIEALLKIVPQQEPVLVQGQKYSLDIKKLMRVTAMVESSYATGSYQNRIPKTYMQLEKKTALYSLSQGKVIREKIEKELGRKLIWDSDRDAMYVAYIVYINRLKHNKRWLDLYTKYFTNEDIEWYVYKVFFNSILGSATYPAWLRQQKQLGHLVK